MFFGNEATDKNIFEALQEDLIGRNSDIKRFINLVDALGGGRSIAIDGTWGSGKTFFVKQCKMALDAMNPVCKMPEIMWEEYSEEKPIEDEHLRSFISKQVGDLGDNSLAESCFTVYFDAWENDSEVDPLISLVYSIACDISEEYVFDDDPSCKTIAADIIEMITGRDIGKLIDHLRGNNSVSVVKESRQLRDKINQFLDSLSYERGNRVLIIIDELDRCKPVYAIKTLERIKHYFNHKNINYVFSVNLAQLEQTVKTCYGQTFDAGKYLDRFFDIRISLPPAKTDNFYTKIGIDNGSYIYEKSCLDVARYFNMSLREITKYYQTTRIAAYNRTHSNNTFMGGFEQGTWFALIVIVPFLIALRMTDNNEYNAFVAGESSGRLIECIDSSEFLKKWITEKYIGRDEKGKFPEEEYKQITQEAYEAIFLNKYDKVNYVQVYDIEFGRDQKDEIIRRVSCFSNDVCLD